MPLLRRPAAVVAALCALDVEVKGRPLRLALAALIAVCAAFVALCLEAVVTAQPPYRFGDFYALWSSATLAHDGQAAANYDAESLRLGQSALGMRPGENNPFPYPPPFLLALAPLGGLHRAVAYALFIGASFGLYLWALADGRWRAWPRLAAAFAAPATGVNLIFGQTGFLTGGLMLGGLNLAARRPLVAGVLFGLLAFKPQLGLLAPIALVAAGLWRTIAAAIVTIVVCALAATAAFGAPIWGLWLSSLAAYSHMAMVDRLMPTVAGSLGLAGVAPPLVWAAQAAASVTVAIVVWRACRGGLTPRATALVAVGAFLATPHALAYDLPMTTAAAIWSLERRLRAGGALFVSEFIILALALALPAAELAVADHGPPIAWLPLLALFVVIAADPYATRAARLAAANAAPIRRESAPPVARAA